jgi:hypothetical protein
VLRAEAPVAMEPGEPASRRGLPAELLKLSIYTVPDPAPPKLGRNYHPLPYLPILTVGFSTLPATRDERINGDDIDVATTVWRDFAPAEAQAKKCTL